MGYRDESDSRNPSDELDLFFGYAVVLVPGNLVENEETAQVLTWLADRALCPKLEASCENDVFRVFDDEICFDES